MTQQPTASDRPTFGEAELEVVGLKALTDCLDSIINHAILTVRGADPNTEIVFPSHIHQKYFTSLVVDFLAKPNKKMFGLEGSYLEVLRTICDSPRLGSEELAAATSDSVRDLESWLDTEVAVEVWLPSIGTETDLKVRRQEFIWITGNASKHNFTRLSRVADRLVEIFERSEIELDAHTALKVLDEFYERFHDDILIYDASAFTELLNRIRWSIHDYLLPHFEESYTPLGGDPPRYEYQYPESVTHDFARTCYWDLMNEVRRGPYIRRFQAPEYLKLRY